MVACCCLLSWRGETAGEEDLPERRGRSSDPAWGWGETENGYRSLSLPLVPVGAKTKFPALSFPPSYLFPA